MRNLYILSLSLLLSVISLGQCPSGNITLSTQAEVNNFSSAYPGCSQITVDILISGMGITNLNGLSQITSMNGKLTVFSTSISTLGGLGSINFFGSNSALSVSNNPNLISLGNLSGTLNRPDFGGLSLKDLPGLSSLNELSGLSSTSTLWIENLTSIGSLSGLQNLSVTGLFLLIRGNDMLTDLAALSGNLGSYNGLTISNNASLVTLSGMEGINLSDNGVASSFFNLNDNPALTDISALNSITFLPEDLRITGNSQLASLQSLSNISGSASTVYIENNDSLLDLNGLQGISNVLNEFWVKFNDNLVSLDGVEGLSNTGNPPVLWIWLGDNPQLTDISAFNNLNPNSVSFCLFDNNTNLSVCATQFTCAALDAGVGFTLDNNATGCNTVPEIEQACLLSNSNVINAQLTIVPSPVRETLYVNLSENIKFRKAIIFSIAGEELIVDNSTQIQTSQLSSGIYFVKIETDKGFVVRKIVKE